MPQPESHKTKKRKHAAAIAEDGGDAAPSEPSSKRSKKDKERDTKKHAKAKVVQDKGKGRDGERKPQRESILRFDGMLVQHLAAERDRMKRITNDYLSPSATGSPVQTRPSMQLP